MFERDHSDSLSNLTATPSSTPFHSQRPFSLMALEPRHRFMLALFFFLDVVVLSSGCLILSGKIVLPF